MKGQHGITFLKALVFTLGAGYELPVDGGGHAGGRNALLCQQFGQRGVVVDRKREAVPTARGLVC
ncbi:MAG: hypothetical protein R3E42_12150 [Burkholderiaceae bacterium]